ncbi:MAG: hypothetical protein KKD35_08360, partial [Elusimicrobia bacterium]|nr:hypothetical protein [Elusimicrobiota bacterium]
MNTFKRFLFLSFISYFLSLIGVYAAPRVLATIDLKQFSSLNLRNPYAIAYDETKNHIFVAGWGDNKLLIIDPSTKNLVDEIKGINWPWKIVLEPEKKLVYIAGYEYVTGYGYNDTIYGINTEQKSIQKKLTIDNGWLLDFVIDKEKNLIYGITLKWEYLNGTRRGYASFITIDAVNGIILSRLELGENLWPSGIAFDSSKQKIYISVNDFMNWNYTEKIFIVDLQTKTISNTVTLNTTDTWSFLTNVKLDKRTNTLYAADYNRKIWYLDTITEKLSGKIDVPCYPWSLSIDIKKNQLYLPDNYMDRTIVVDLDTKLFKTTIKAGDDPCNAAV